MKSYKGFFVRKILFTILSIFMFQCFASAQTLKFAQVTDLHLKDDSEIFMKVVKDINKTKDIEFVVFTGDNLGRASKTLLSNFLSGARKLNKPYYVLLGTKDVSKNNKLSKKTYIDMVRRVNPRHPKNLNYVFKKKNIVFIVVDGSKELIPSLSGYYPTETIEWVDKQLSQYAQNNVVILQHYPIANKPDNEIYYTYNSIEYLKMLHSHKNVKAVVTGHYHKNEEVMFDGVYHITSPDASKGKYKIIEIDLESSDIYTMVKEVK